MRLTKDMKAEIISRLTKKFEIDEVPFEKQERAIGNRIIDEIIKPQQGWENYMSYMDVTMKINFSSKEEKFIAPYGLSTSCCSIVAGKPYPIKALKGYSFLRFDTLSDDIRSGIMAKMDARREYFEHKENIKKMVESVNTFKQLIALCPEIQSYCSDLIPMDATCTAVVDKRLVETVRGYFK